MIIETKKKTIRKMNITILLLLFGAALQVTTVEATMEIKNGETTQGISIEEKMGETTTEEIDGNFEETVEKEDNTIVVSEIDLGDYAEQMIVGEKQLLSVTILPFNASEIALTYSSSDTKVATINGMGRITALAMGNTTITVTAGQVSQSFILRVIEKEDTTISVTNIEIEDYESELEVGKTTNISGTIVPSNATDSTIIYTSSDKSIATVSSTGEVKGISAGNVTITLTAGEISKTVTLTIKVNTIGITLNSDYLVLKPSEKFQLSAKVTPADAFQTISYKSLDTSVATVSASGLVTGKEVGITTIIVSNGDCSVAVAVIVNQAVNYNRYEEKIEEIVEEDVYYADTVLASEQSIIDSQMLKYFYKTKKVLKIVGDGYIIEIDGQDIVNYKNEIYTDILIKKEDGVVSFVLNQENELCGAVTLFLEKTEGKYLYLYNVSKEKYEQIESVKLDQLKLTTAGEYQIRSKKLKSDMQIVLYVIVGGMSILLVGIVIYIVIKRKYWFW